MSRTFSSTALVDRRDRDGFALWEDRAQGVEVRFVGQGPKLEYRATFARIEPGVTSSLAWLHQVHSATVVRAADGLCGHGDALVTDRSGLALAIATADCVPVILGTATGLGVAHAGWRGIVAGVVGATLSVLGDPGPRATAWLGPSIGPCCYEVGEEVASEVAAASAPSVVVATSGERPHLDLAAAVRQQLASAGVTAVRTVADCTRCNANVLWSYRRDRSLAGRNLSFAWRVPA